MESLKYSIQGAIKYVIKTRILDFNLHLLGNLFKLGNLAFEINKINVYYYQDIKHLAVHDIISRSRRIGFINDAG